MGVWRGWDGWHLTMLTIDLRSTRTSPVCEPKEWTQRNFFLKVVSLHHCPVGRATFTQEWQTPKLEWGGINVTGKVHPSIGICLWVSWTHHASNFFTIWPEEDMFPVRWHFFSAQEPFNKYIVHVITVVKKHYSPLNQCVIVNGAMSNRHIELRNKITLWNSILILCNGKEVAFKSPFSRMSSLHRKWDL